MFILSIKAEQNTHKMDSPMSNIYCLSSRKFRQEYMLSEFNAGVSSAVQYANTNYDMTNFTV